MWDLRPLFGWLVLDWKALRHLMVHCGRNWMFTEWHCHNGVRRSLVTCHRDNQDTIKLKSPETCCDIRQVIPSNGNMDQGKVLQNWENLGPFWRERGIWCQIDREIAFSQCCLEGRHILPAEGSMGVFTSEKIKLVWLGGLIKLISVQPYN